MNDKKVLSVTQLNIYVKSLLESSTYLKDIAIVGEISNFTNHYRTGHFYMSLKDENGLIKAVMFKASASKVNFDVQNGMRVICKGRVSLYEKDGTYQFYITSMQLDGEGSLQMQFEQLKEKLQKEGLFDQDKKKRIPKIPNKIAIITSSTGAALQDILNILKRRFPAVEVVLIPAAVQGESAAPQLRNAVKFVNAKINADVIIIGRGGGAIEDLWAFNDEELAREIAKSKIPVVSAVGHETDFTICDFVADLRAPTPSASAELCVPNKTDILDYLAKSGIRRKNGLFRTFENKNLKLEALKNKQCLSNPLFWVNQKSQTLDILFSKLQTQFKDLTTNKKSHFLQLTARLNSLSPTAVLLRGYTTVQKNGSTITKSAQLTAGDEISISFSDGQRQALIKE